ncbi:hypothetical protein [Zhihengliuella alba]|uniref:hypothetical protein n=1 Tax=Zhihengliuella alba TaxID=547018 RepID=UPI0031E4F37C
MPEYAVDEIDDISVVAGAAIYHLPIGDGMILSFVLRGHGAESDLLRVALHGARTAKVKLPYFLRVNSSLQDPYPFLAFSDPTLGLDRGNLLSWYLGTPRVDVDDWMEAVIRHVASKIDSGGVIFEGSSGGGFAALRLSARFSSSVALCFSPQTDTFNYLGGVFVKRVVRNLFGAADRDVVQSAYPYRFSVIDLYRDGMHRNNLVTYAQNDGDDEHVRDHMSPFLQSIEYDAATGRSNLDNFVLVREHVADGHGPHPITRWNELFEESVQRLRRHIMAADPLPPGAEPSCDRRGQVGLSGVDRADSADAPENIGDGATPMPVVAPTDFSDGRLAFRVYPPKDHATASRTLVAFLHSVVDPTVHPHPFLDSPLRPRELGAWSVVIPDPTFSSGSTLRVGWYLGQESWDPLLDVEKALLRVAERTDCEEVLLVAPSTAAIIASRLVARSTVFSALFLAPVFSLADEGRDSKFVRRVHESAFPSFASIQDVARSDSRASWIQMDAARVRVFVNSSSPSWGAVGSVGLDQVNAARASSVLLPESREGLFSGQQTAANPAGVASIIEEHLNG